MFKKVNPRQNFVEAEHRHLKRWYEKGIIKKYLKKNKNAKKRFAFLDGPITANNSMGVHHAWGRTLKDLFQKFKTMQGFAQRYQNGFDNQGLWVEVEVEKKKGFKTKKDIEKYGIDKFVEECKKHTLHFADIQTEQSKRLGYFMDWGNSYYTMSDENNYTIWHFLKTCHEKGWLYKGHDVVPWCPRCGTAISQHEILTEEYKELTHKSVYVRLPIKNRKNEYLLIWTTTPWTLTSNVAVAVNPELNYVKVKQNDNIYYLLEKAVSCLEGEYKIERKLKGKELIGLEYKGLFDDLPEVREKRPKHIVIVWDEISEEEGTGLVHIAPGCGEEDFQLSKEHNLVAIAPIDEEGKFVKGFGSLSGKKAGDVPEEIFAKLKQGGFLYKVQDYTHQYPTCWRCKSELLFRLVDEWYISMDKPDKVDKKDPRTLRKKMISVAKKIKWHPSFGLDRELDWLTNMHDWLISKKRYWGLALPIFECSCGNFETVGSKEELKEKAVEGWEEFAGHSPHRPWIDKVKIKCSKCGKTISRIPDVGNPWLDAGIVSFSTLVDPKTKKVSYMEDKKYWKEWFPADLVLECFPGQFKNWFYSLIAMSTVLENTNPFKALLGHNTVFDECGEEMHKSKGNAIWFDDAAEKMGVDIMRWMYCRHNPTINLNFGYGPANEIRRQFFSTLWNTYSFFVMYANANNYKPKKGNLKKKNLLDKWIVSELHNLVREVTENLERYKPDGAARIVEEFVDNLSNWYVRRSRRRFWRSESKTDTKEALDTLYSVLLTLSKIIAPFMPFVSEEIYLNLTLGEKKDNTASIHLEDFPKPNKGLIDGKLNTQMNSVREIASKVLSERAEKGIKVRQPLSGFKVKGNISDKLLVILKDETNVKKIELQGVRSAKEAVYIEGSLDTKITPKLEQEGLLREFVRQIQSCRKEAGYNVDDIVSLDFVVSKKDKLLKEALNKFEKELKKELLVKNLGKEKQDVKYDVGKELDFKGKGKVWIGIKKV
ncbi:isoleucine--tRNA ligase [bacterium (Candidatus Torokbacteria) CG_4_10_14_0_2_um_filter_35_8]|nr:MAG: isoleucine--tRNA ligase [bacterium (Candidatus Torokbacteria) CG_4_10_14_0_2_um_filter_35_8]